MTAKQKEPIPTLYEWAGGKEVLENLSTVFYDKVLKDDLLFPVFKNMSADHRKHVAHFIGEVFGGPKFYTEDDHGSHAKMIGHHLGKMLDEAKRKRWMMLLLESADETGLANDPEFRSALVGYLEWGSRIAVINSNTSENPVNENEPMPKWGWGVPGGPYIPNKTTSLPVLIFLISCFFLSDSCTSNQNKKGLSLSLDKVNIVDLTHTLNSSFPYIPTEVTYGFEIKPIATFEKMGVAANEWKIHEHIGTQFDAPNHFIKGGMSADQIDVRNLLIRAVVINISDKAAKNRDAVLTIADILRWEKLHDTIPRNAGVLIYSGWDKKLNSSEFIGMDSAHKKHFPGISKEAADFLVNKRSIAGVGVDMVSFDPGIDNTYQSHRIILGKGLWALECLANLNKIPVTGAYIFVGAPKVEGATGGLCRVIAVW